MSKFIADLAIEIIKSRPVSGFIEEAVKQGTTAVVTLITPYVVAAAAVLGIPGLILATISVIAIATYIVENWDDLKEKLKEIDSSSTGFDDSSSYSDSGSPATDFDDPWFWIVRD